MLRWLKNLKHPPSKREIETAYESAQLERAGRRSVWRFGICDRKGELVGLIVLVSDGARDALLRSMKKLGFGGPVVLGKPGEMKGCDFLFDCK
jgi:hypothetical protein